MEKSRRNSNVELFRIILMILIIAHHFVVNSGIVQLIKDNPLSFRGMFFSILGGYGKIAINCFVLISGYYMCKMHLSAKKYAKLLSEVLFYRIAGFLLFETVGGEGLHLSTFLADVIQIEFDSNFTSCYLMFLLTVPFINILISGMNRIMHCHLVVLLLFLYSISSTLTILNVICPGSFWGVRFNYVEWFFVIYIIGAYIRLYQHESKLLYNGHTIKFIVCCICSAASIILSNILYNKYGSELWFFVADSNKLLGVLVSVYAFVYFVNLDVKYNRTINIIGGSTFGVLLIHANCDAMRKWLWMDFLNVIGVWSEKLFWLIAVLDILAVFIVCAVIDIIRKNTVEKVWMNFIDRAVMIKASSIKSLCK